MRSPAFPTSGGPALALALFLSATAVAAPPVLSLKTSEPETADPKADGGIMLREIFRQAVLVAARDELHMLTRDATLREVPAGAADALDIKTSCVRGGQYTVTLTRGTGDKKEVIWTKTVPLPDTPLDYQGLAATAEKLARTEIPEALRKAGYKGEPRTPSMASAGDKPVEELLGAMRVTNQFQALRQLHAPGKPEQEAGRLGGLVRAYSNLGQLTDYQWSPNHKAFKARALVYADRLVARDPKSPAAHWHRAYAQALSGFPGAALASLKEAKKLHDSLPADKRPATPSWVALVDAFCHRDFVRLAAEARPGRPDASLATVLAYLSLEEEGSNVTFVQFIRKSAEAEPELYRFYDGAFAAGQLGDMHTASALGPLTLTNTLGDRLAEFPDMPEPVRKVSKQRELEDVSLAAAGMAKALVEAGHPDRDTREPSWTTLGRMVQEIQFAQAARTGYLQRRVLGWSPEGLKDFVRDAVKACEDHPYRDYLVAFSVDSQRQAEAYRALLQGVPLMDLGPSARPLVTAMTTIDGADKSPGREAARRLTRGLDATSDDLAEILRTRAPEARPAVARQFLEVSPHSPQPVVALIENDWEGVKDKAATWEKQYAGSASVLAALGKKYASLKQYTDAERCLRAHVRLSPDRAGYQALAGVFKDQGNTDRWKETLDDYLKTEDSGLAHAGVRVELARHFMARKEFDKAKPYADAAAETAAAWAMLCAADVYEGLKDWETAEKWVRETAEHYETSRQTWLFWCVRTGKGDLAAARRLALERVELLRGTRDRNQLILSAACFILCEKPADAYEALHRQVTANPNDRLLAMQAALLADELGKTAERDELLAQVVKRSKAIEKKKADPKPADPKADPKTPPKPAAKKTPATDPETQAKLATLFKEIGELASLFIAALAPDAKPDLEAIAKAIEGVHADYRCEAQYLSGRFLELHGHPTQARKYYEACAETGGSRTPVVLGTFRLKAMKK